MHSYVYKVYELHYYVECTNFYRESDSKDVVTEDEQVRYFATMEELVNRLNELKSLYDGRVEFHEHGFTSKRLSKATYIEVRSIRRIYAFDLTSSAKI